MFETYSVTGELDQCQRRQQVQMGPVAQRQPQVSRRKARMFAHDGFRPRPFPVLDRIDHDTVMVLRDDQDLMRFRQHRLRHHEAARRRERQRRGAVDLPDQRRAVR